MNSVKLTSHMTHEDEEQTAMEILWQSGEFELRCQVGKITIGYLHPQSAEFELGEFRLYLQDFTACLLTVATLTDRLGVLVETDRMTPSFAEFVETPISFWMDGLSWMIYCNPHNSEALAVTTKISILQSPPIIFRNTQSEIRSFALALSKLLEETELVEDRMKAIEKESENPANDLRHLN